MSDRTSIEAERLASSSEPDRPTPGRRSARLADGWRWFDVVLAVGVAALLLFPVLARLAADAQPIPPRAGPTLPRLSGGPSPQIRSLPEFVTLAPAQVASVVSGGARAEAAEIHRLAVATFGARGARRLERRLAAERLPAQSVPHGSLILVSLRGLPAVPASRTGAENDLAAMLIEAAALSQETGRALDGSPRYLSNGPAALALLQGAERSGGCASQVNHAFLLASAAPYAVPIVTRRAYRQAVAACPHDPTALWALGQYQSQQGDHQLAAATFTALERRFPRAAAGWSGAGDDTMRRGYELQDADQPFTARQQFQRALALYRRAEALAPTPGNRAGVARALAALDQEQAAVAMQQRAVADDPASADLQVRLLDYLERAHRFAAAAVVAQRLESVHRFASGPGLIAEPPPLPELDTSLGAEDAEQAMSAGADRLAPVQVTLEPPPVLTSPVTAGDLSYLPVYLPMGGIGGPARWCPRWSRLVDLLVSRHPADVLSNLAGATNDLRSGENDCAAYPPNDVDQRFGIVSPQELAGVAALELGNVSLARAWGQKAGGSVSYLEDLRQNLWRYAGDYGHAATAAAQWAAVDPSDYLPWLRQGEIAFLRHRYDESAGDFALAVNEVRYSADAGGATEAAALLDQGTALAYAGRQAEAQTTLATADATGIKSYGPAQNIDGAVYATYAEEAAGNALLDANRPVEAASHYAVAADSARRAGLYDATPAGGGNVAPSVLDNNFAIAELGTGDPGRAASLAQQSIGDDRGDAIFWWTEADAEAQLGQDRVAIADYRAALARDPTEFPAANNLGVLLLRQDRIGAAVDALRRSVGANPGYATGWFNLAIALGRLGPLHLFAAQGSLARAVGLDAKLASREPRPVLDRAVYLSNLDLSKPLPPKWTFARTQERAPLAAAGLSAILLVALGLARSLASRGGDGNPEKWLDWLSGIDRRVAPVALRAPAVAVAFTAALLLWPLHSGPAQGWAFLAPFVVGIAVLIALVVRARQLAATRAGVRVHQETWLPGVALGILFGAIGLGWSPLPVARARGRAETVHWAAPVALLLLALALLLLAVWLQVPVTRSLGAAALVMTASMLTPVKPLDGATLTEKRAGHVPGIVVLGTALLLLTGLL